MTGLRRALRSLACAIVPAAAAAQTQADSASVTKFYSDWFSSAAQGPERYSSFYAPDGSALPPNMPPAVGRAAIVTWFVQSQAATDYTVQPTGLTVNEMRFLSPTLVVHRSTLRGRRVPKAAGMQPREFETKYFDLLRKNAEGRWEVVYRMWSDNT